MNFFGVHFTGRNRPFWTPAIFYFDGWMVDGGWWMVVDGGWWMVVDGRKKGSSILLKLCTAIVPPKLFFYYLEFWRDNFLVGLKIDF